MKKYRPRWRRSRRRSIWPCSSSRSGLFRDPSAATAPQLPKIQQTVFAYGYPEGGMDLSITRGNCVAARVCRILSCTDGLRIQVDAAINPGNSGGPAIVDGEMIGLVFSKLQQSDNIGYIIPMEEIELFFKDIEDGNYDGKPMLSINSRTWKTTLYARKLKLEKKITGVLLQKAGGARRAISASPGDILTKIGDYPSTTREWCV